MIVDCSASEAVPDVYGAWLGAGLHVVTPNKKFGAGDEARCAAAESKCSVRSGLNPSPAQLGQGRGGAARSLGARGCCGVRPRRRHAAAPTSARKRAMRTPSLPRPRAPPPPHTHNLPAGSYQAALAAGARGGGVFLSEASVGAGLPVLSTLRELVQTGDRVTRIEVRGRPLPRWLSAVVGGGGGYSPTF